MLCFVLVVPDAGGVHFLFVSVSVLRHKKYLRDISKYV